MPELYRELIKLSDSDMYPFHMPGHKRNLESTPMKGAFRCDITEIDGYDNLHDEEGIILEAEERANRLYGAEKTYFLVNGSSCGVLSAVSAAVTEGGRILAARGSHKSFYHAAYLRRLDISYLPYKQDVRYGIPDSYTAEDVRRALGESMSASTEAKPDSKQGGNIDFGDISCGNAGIRKSSGIQAVFITSPTYEGKCSDVAGIAKVCHEYGIPLIVDAAHGAHFGLNKNKESGENGYTIPDSAVHQGADIVVHSVHKTLPSMTQTALIHVRGDLVDKALLKRFLRVYQSSSPSYVLMSSIDLCMKEIEENGEEFFSRLLYFREKIQKACEKCSILKVVGRSDIEDPAKVLIFVNKHAMTGKELYDILREEYSLQLEMSGNYYALAIISGWDKEAGIDRLIEAIRDIDARLIAKEPGTNVSGKEDSGDSGNVDGRCTTVSLPKVAEPLYKAWDAVKEKVVLEKASGRISGDFVNLYPPGIPLLAPGEIVSEEMILELKGYLSREMNLQGVEVSDDGKATLQVLKY